MAVIFNFGLVVQLAFVFYKAPVFVIDKPLDFDRITRMQRIGYQNKYYSKEQF